MLEKFKKLLANMFHIPAGVLFCTFTAYLYFCLRLLGPNYQPAEAHVTTPAFYSSAKRSQS